MDILGYRRLIQEATENGTQSEFLATLHQALFEARQWLEDAFYPNKEQVTEKDLYALKAFTDNIVMGWPIHEDAEWEFGDAFGKLSIFQFHMLVSGFFVRGAISLGDAYIDEFVVSGDALVEAYDAESRLARDPRIILTDSAISAVKSHIEYYSPASFAPQARELLMDSDGQWFLNYLEQVVFPLSDDNPEHEHLERHKKAVENSLTKYKNQPREFSKIAWVAEYHNFFCDLHSQCFDNAYRIETELFRAPPKPIVG